MQQSQQKRTGLIVAVLVVLGLTAGVGLGLLMGWVIWPVNYFDTTIADLQVDHKERYIILVGSAYALDHDLEKAQERLDQLEAPNIKQWIAELTDRYIAEGQDEADIGALVELAHGLGVDSPQMVAWLEAIATPMPLPTDTPLPPPTPAPTDTPTDRPTVAIPPTDTPVPETDTPQPQATDTPLSQRTATPVLPTDTPISPTNTPKPKTTNTPKPPPPTNTPKPPATQWTWTARLVGPGEDSQGCEYGNLQIRITVLDAQGGQIGGVWLHDRYSGQYQVTGNVGSPDFGPGEAKFEYGIGGGGSLCVASGQGGPCVSDYTRDMPCYYAPPFEDLWAVGYCECCEVGISKERCQEFYNSGAQCMKQARHYSWRVVFERSW